VSIYPVFESLNIENVTRLRKIPLRRTKFIADTNLTGIVKYMRMLGFDVYHDPLLSAREIIDISKKENRIILTKSKKLLKFKDVTHGIFVRTGTAEEQIKRIIDYLDIRDKVKPFSRCLRCNNLLLSVQKEKILNRIPPKTSEFCDQYAECRACNKLYWEGTHFINMSMMIDKVLEQPAQPSVCR
jgi:hypothetical protein